MESGSSSNITLKQGFDAHQENRRASKRCTEALEAHLKDFIEASSNKDFHDSTFFLGRFMSVGVEVVLVILSGDLLLRCLFSPDTEQASWRRMRNCAKHDTDKTSRLLSIHGDLFCLLPFSARHPSQFASNRIGRERQRNVNKQTCHDVAREYVSRSDDIIKKQIEFNGL